MNAFILIKKTKVIAQDGQEMEVIEDIHNLGFTDFSAAKKYAAKTLNESDLKNVYFCKIDLVEGGAGADIALQSNLINKPIVTP
jgi:hypothetical protein